MEMDLGSRLRLGRDRLRLTLAGLPVASADQFRSVVVG